VGLSLTVGILADLTAQGETDALAHFRSQFDAINAALRAKNFPEHHEPAELPAGRPPVTAELISYRGLHTLRRLAAHLLASGTLPDPTGPHTPPNHKDPVLSDYYASRRYTTPTTPEQLSPDHPHPGAFKHLMLHSDAEGYYLPLNFRYVISPSPDLKIAGGLIGSSLRLAEECQALASALSLPLDTDPDSDEVQHAIESPGQGDAWRRYGVESHTCLQLHRAAQASLTLNAALVFT
jgi:hypothetical protein